MTRNFRYHVTVLALVSGLLAAPAASEDHTIAISVHIPPIAEALAAGAEGAVGVRSVSVDGGGLMIAGGQETGDAPPVMSVYRSDTNRFDLMLVGGHGPAPMKPAQIDQGTFFARFDFALRDTQNAPGNQGMRLLLSAT